MENQKPVIIPAPFKVGDRVEFTKTVHTTYGVPGRRRRLHWSFPAGTKAEVVEITRFKWMGGLGPDGQAHGWDVVVKLLPGQGLDFEGQEIDGIRHYDLRKSFPTLADYEAMRAAGTFPVKK